VSSPGIDRPLRSEQDFERFAGSLVDITLKAPIGKELGASAGGLISANRKKFRGTLERGEDAGRRTGRSSGGTNLRSSQASGSVPSVRRRRCRHWDLRWMSCARRAWRPWWISKVAGRLARDRLID
jgi:hypothetical protein